MVLEIVSWIIHDSLINDYAASRTVYFYSDYFDIIFKAYNDFSDICKFTFYHKHCGRLLHTFHTSPLQSEM